MTISDEDLKLIIETNPEHCTDGAECVSRGLVFSLASELLKRRQVDKRIVALLTPEPPPDDEIIEEFGFEENVWQWIDGKRVCVGTIKRSF